MPRNALGRGLGALIREPEAQAPAAAPVSGSSGTGTATVRLWVARYGYRDGTSPRTNVGGPTGN